MDKILELMVRKNDGLSVIKLSMVNRGFRAYIRTHWTTWMGLYQRWTRKYFHYCSVQNLPNFTRRPMPQWLQQELSNKHVRPERTDQLLGFLRRVLVLHHATCCGMCGSTRHKVVPYWSLGMALCSFCVQDNLVTDVQLYERYFVSFSRQLALDMGGNTFFFWMATTPQQRTALTIDRIAYPSPTMQTANFYFWKPHLARHLDLPRLASEARPKAAAATIIRAHVRRSLILVRTSRMRGYTLKDKRPIHARLMQKDLTKTGCSVYSSMMAAYSVHNAFLQRQDYIKDTAMEALAAGQATRI